MARRWPHNLTPYLLYLVVVSTIGPLLFGYHLSELNAPQDILTCARKSYTPNAYLSPFPKCIRMNTLEFGLVSSIFTLGGLLGALGAGPAAAKYGRLTTMKYNTAFFTFGPLAEALARNVSTMALGRFVSGIGAGVAVVVVPIYLSEIAPPGRKALLGASTQVMINMGILLTQFLGLFLSQSMLWRVILGVGGIVGLHQLAGLFFAVDSPKWLADHGRPRQAKINLQKIRGKGVDIKKEVSSWGTSTQREQLDEEDSLLNEDQTASVHSSGSSGARSAIKHETVGILQVLLHPQHGQATIAVMIVMVAQQFCGINSIVMYGVSLLSDLLEQSSALLNVFVAAINLVVTLTCSPLPDRFGRKPCLFVSIAGMGISSLLLAFGIMYSLSIMSAIFVLTFVASFAVGLGPVPFILSSELVGPEAVGATQSWALAANWIATFVVAQFFPIINEALGKGKVYFVFAVLAAIFAFFVAVWVPETKGKKNADEVWARDTADDRRED